MLEVIRGTAGHPSTVQGENFTGEVRRDALRDLDATGPSIGNVFFAPAARTHWHAHDDGQLLIAIAGSGWVVDEDGPVKLSAGDMVWVPEGIRHWHGASSTQFMVHMSLSRTKETDWQRAVTDEEFSAVQK